MIVKLEQRFTFLSGGAEVTFHAPEGIGPAGYQTSIYVRNTRVRRGGRFSLVKIIHLERRASAADVLAAIDQVVEAIWEIDSKELTDQEVTKEILTGLIDAELSRFLH